MEQRTLLIDSREQWTQDRSTDTHISAYFDRHGIAYQVVPLTVGDYMYEGGKISVDRKQNLEEVAKNLTNRSDSSRFWREVRRAYQSGITLVILCEHGPDIKTINDVAKWHSRWTKVSGRQLIDAMMRCELAYGVVWQFCSKRSTAKRIIEILNNKEVKRERRKS